MTKPLTHEEMLDIASQTLILNLSQRKHKMINFNFKIELPIDRWGNIWSTTPRKTPFRYKYWDFDFFRSADILSFEFSWKTRTDHAGVNVGVGLFGYSVDFRFYDSRHWDDENNCYEV